MVRQYRQIDFVRSEATITLAYSKHQCDHQANGGHHYVQRGQGSGTSGEGQAAGTDDEQIVH